MIPPSLLRRSPGRHTTLAVRLSPDEQRTLEGWQRSSHISVLQARRGALLLLCAHGVPIGRAARHVGLTRRHAYKWLKRYLAQGLRGLEDPP